MLGQTGGGETELRSFHDPRWTDSHKD